MRGGVFFYREICISPVKARFFLVLGSRSPLRFSVQTAGQALRSRNSYAGGLEKNRCCGITFLRKQKLALRRAPPQRPCIRIRALLHRSRRAPTQDLVPHGGKVRVGVFFLYPANLDLTLQSQFWSDSCFFHAFATYRSTSCDVIHNIALLFLSYLRELNFNCYFPASPGSTI